MISLSKLKNIKVNVDEFNDSVWIELKGGAEDSVVELSPGLNLELDEKGDVIGIEILNYSNLAKSRSNDTGEFVFDKQLGQPNVRLNKIQEFGHLTV